MNWFDTLLLIGAVVALVMIALSIRRLRSQIGGAAILLRCLIERQDEANQLLREIAHDTDRMPKVETRSWRDDYPA